MSAVSLEWVRTTVRRLDPDDILLDAWTESDGCWADVWHERHGEYLACNARPDPESELGLCPEHEGKMRELKGEAV